MWHMPQMHNAMQAYCYDWETSKFTFYLNLESWVGGYLSWALKER